MYRTFTCLVEQHTAWVVPLAGAVCWVSSHTALRLLHQARASQGLPGQGLAGSAWLIAASVSAGAGIWSTHFIGMLGYDPGIAVSYSPVATLLSLAGAILAAMAALLILRDTTRRRRAACAGVLLGSGVAAMHLSGMAGVQVPGVLVWDRWLLAEALVAGCGLAAIACVVSVDPRTARHRGLQATILTAAIATLHVTAMAAVEVVPDPGVGEPGLGLPRLALAAGIAAIMLAILGFGLLALFAGRLHRANRALGAGEAAHRLSEERLALAVDTDGLWDLTLPTGEMWLSDRWQAMLGYAPGALRSHRQTWERLIHPDDRPTVLRLLAEHVEGRSQVYECEHRLQRQDGGWCWVLARGKVVARDADGCPARMVGLLFDTTVRREAERRIAHMALHDALTGLPNRALFRERLDQQLAQARRHGGDVAILACDLDRFKAVNDSYGHPAGDALLRVVAERLRGVVRAGDTIARLGGDEFAIVMGGLDGPHAAGLVAGRLIEAVGQPIDLECGTVSVGISIGIAVGPSGPTPDDLFKSADIALYQAKGAGRNTFRYGIGLEVAGPNLLERDRRVALHAPAR